jgi:hypothetical protein
MMKKLFLFIAIIMLTATLSAQQIYNGSFEAWTYYTNPDGWGTWSSTIAQYNGNLGDSLYYLASRDTINVPGIYPNDTVSLRLTVDTATLPAQGLDTLAGFASLGGASYIGYPDTPIGLQFGYYPYANKPDSLIFEYKYVPAAGFNDSALIAMTMNRFDSLGDSEVIYIYSSWLINATPQWTHMAVPLTYLQHDTLAPDSIQLIILSSISYPAHPGTTLWIDSISFDASVDIIPDTTGIRNIKSTSGVKAYPNPANSQINIAVQQNEVGSSIRLFDAAGRKVYDGVIDRTGYIIDTRNLAPATYSIVVNSTDRLTIYRGHMAIVH